MNICIVTSSFPINRNDVYHRYLEEVIELLHENGHNIMILTQDKRGIKEIFLPHAEVIWFPWRMNQVEVISAIHIKNIKGLISILSLVYNGVKASIALSKEKKVDVFLCLWVLPSGFYVFLKNLIGNKTPYVLWALGSDIYSYKNNIFSKFILRNIIKGSKHVFADGFDLCKIIRSISGRECEFLPTVHNLNLLDTKAASDTEIKNEISFLCVAANLTYVKGVDTLIESLKLLRNKFGYLKFKLNIIGDGEMKSALLKEVDQNNLMDQVAFLGRVIDEKLFREYFTSADCVIIPSRSDSIPVILSEAIQFDKPVIVTNAGDMEYIVNKYNLGMVAEKNNPVDLAEKIKEFIDSPFQLRQEDKNNVLKLLLFEKSKDKLLQSLCSK